MAENFILPIILQLAGVLVIMAEIILPSGGILAIVAVGVLGYSISIVFINISSMAGYAFVAADILLIPILVIVGLKLLAKSPVTLRKNLSREEGVSSQPLELNGYLYMEGTTITDLRPVGTALIDGRRVDVVTRGEYLEKETAILVTAVTGNQIVVRKKDDS